MEPEPSLSSFMNRFFSRRSSGVETAADDAVQQGSWQRVWYEGGVTNACQCVPEQDGKLHIQFEFFSNELKTDDST